MKKILVISHDAGGANILASLINKYKHKFLWNYYVENPALNIFNYNKIHLIAEKIVLKKNNFDQVFHKNNFDLLITGTSWGSDLERLAIRSAKKNNIRSATFLDHWINYRERFGNKNDWKKKLPDYILTGDELAYKTAKDLDFPEKNILKVENPYFENIIKKSKFSKKINKIKKILYISEPVTQDVDKKISPEVFFDTEFKALEDILNQLKYINERWKLKIRLHPSEKINKYNKLLTNKFNNLKNSIIFSDPNKISLINDCMSSDLVIGIQSMALFIAHILKRKTLCYLSNNKSINYLNYWGIKAIRNKKDILNEIELNNKSLALKLNKIYSGSLFAVKIKKLL